MMLEVGAPLGWGPVGLTAEQVGACLDRIRAAVEPLHVDATVVCQRTTQLPTATGPGEKEHTEPHMGAAPF